MKKIVKISAFVFVVSLLFVSCGDPREKDSLKVEIAIEQEAETVKAELEDRLCAAITYVIDESKYKKDKFTFFLRDLKEDELTSTFVNANNMMQNLTISDREVRANSIFFNCYNKNGSLSNKVLSYRKTAGNPLLGGMQVTTMQYYYVDGDVSISGNFSGSGIEINLSDLGLSLSGVVTVDYDVSFEDCSLVKGWNEVYMMIIITTLRIVGDSRYEATMTFKTTTVPQAGLSWGYINASNTNIMDIISQL
jgi:hypothetical protein